MKKLIFLALATSFFASTAQQAQEAQPVAPVVQHLFAPQADLTGLSLPHFFPILDRLFILNPRTENAKLLIAGLLNVLVTHKPTLPTGQQTMVDTYVRMFQKNFGVTLESMDLSKLWPKDWNLLQEELTPIPTTFFGAVEEWLQKTQKSVLSSPATIATGVIGIITFVLLYQYLHARHPEVPAGVRDVAALGEAFAVPAIQPVAPEYDSQPGDHGCAIAPFEIPVIPPQAMLRDAETQTIQTGQTGQSVSVQSLNELIDKIETQLKDDQTEEGRQLREALPAVRLVVAQVLARQEQQQCDLAPFARDIAAAIGGLTTQRAPEAPNHAEVVPPAPQPIAGDLPPTAAVEPPAPKAPGSDEQAGGASSAAPDASAQQAALKSELALLANRRAALERDLQELTLRLEKKLPNGGAWAAKMKQLRQADQTHEQMRLNLQNLNALKQQQESQLPTAKKRSDKNAQWSLQIQLAAMGQEIQLFEQRLAQQEQIRTEIQAGRAELQAACADDSEAQAMIQQFEATERTLNEVKEQELALQQRLAAR